MRISLEPNAVNLAHIELQSIHCEPYEQDQFYQFLEQLVLYFIDLSSKMFNRTFLRYDKDSTLIKGS